jgi:hypothetical protein
MEESHNPQPASPLEQRKHRRFSLRYPVTLQLQGAVPLRERHAMSRNISSQSVLLETDFPVTAQAQVNFVIVVEGEHILRAIRLTGQGEVIRVSPLESGAGFLIAIACGQPIADIDIPGGLPN